jgi:hypothetical protein
VNDFEVIDEQLVISQHIINTEVLAAPFDDIKPRPKARPMSVQVKAPAKKVEKNLSLLSFADEEMEEQDQVVQVKKGKSAYHHVDDARIQRELAEQEKKREELLKQVHNANTNNMTQKSEDTIKQKLTKKRILSTEESHTSTESQVSTETREEEERLKREILDMKKKKEESVEKEVKPSFLQEQRMKYLTKKKKLSNTDKQKQLLEKLSEFKETLKNTEKNPSSDDWKSHALKFEKPEMEKTTIDPMLKQVEEAEYVVYDPLSGKVPQVKLSRHQQILMGQKKLEKW